MKKKPELSVVVLCYHAEEHLISFAEQISRELNQARIDFELILVANFDEDAARDRTPEIAKKLAQRLPHCTCIAEPKKGRMGWDLRQGLASTTGNFIAFLDGDGQALISDIQKLYLRMVEERSDFGKIYRTQRGDPLIRKIISRIYNLLFAIFFPTVQLRDINAKPKLITRAAYDKMKLSSDDWFADAEIVLEARRLRLKVSEISSISLENSWRKSFIGIFAIAEFLKNMVKYRINYWFFRR